MFPSVPPPPPPPHPFFKNCFLPGIVYPWQQPSQNYYNWLYRTYFVHGMFFPSNKINRIVGVHCSKRHELTEY